MKNLFAVIFAILFANFTFGQNVNPLIQTQWGQGGQTNYQWYNDSCPYDATAGRNTIAGCNAVAMATIMKYYNYPSKGIGEYCYSANYTRSSVTYNYGTLCANFEGTTYNYNLMPNQLSGPNSAVAQLIYHCGVSVNMKYNPTNSTSQGTLSNGDKDLTRLDPTYNDEVYYKGVLTSLRDHFGYSSEMKQIKKSDTSEIAYIQILKEQLDKGQPVIYYSSSHAWVCDGYKIENGQTLFHFNFGWTGQCNDYFSLEKIRPYMLNSNKDTTWVQDHTNGQAMIINIKPSGNVNITEVKNVPSIKVYPNPTTDKVFVETESNIKVYSTHGQLLQEVYGREVDLSNYPSGLYLLQVNGISTKVVKR